jgi:hypothetical protein
VYANSIFSRNEAANQGAYYGQLQMKKRKQIFLKEYNRVFTKMGMPLPSSVEEAVETQLKDKLRDELLHQLRLHVKTHLMEMK